MKRLLIVLGVILILFLVISVVLYWGTKPNSAHAAGQGPICGSGRVTVTVRAGESAALCPGVTVHTGVPVARTQVLMPALATTASPILFLQCSWTNGWTIAGLDTADFTVQENYGLGYYSDIESWGDPPAEWMYVSAAAEALG